MLQAWQDKQATSIPVAQLHSFKGICGTCSYTAAHLQTLAWMAESQPPMQNQGCQSQWKSHFFQLLRGFCALENMCSFLQLSSPRSFLSPYLGTGGSGVTATAWGTAALASGFKEGQDKTCAMRCGDSYTFVFWHTLCKPRWVRCRVSVQPDRSTAAESRPGHALNSWCTYQQTPDVSTLMQNCWQEWFHLQLLWTSSFHKNHFICISCGEDHTRSDGLLLLLLAIR